MMMIIEDSCGDFIETLLLFVLATLIVYCLLWISLDVYAISRRMHIWIQGKLSRGGIKKLKTASNMTGYLFCGGSSPMSLGCQASFISRDCELALSKFWSENNWEPEFLKEGASLQLKSCSLAIFNPMSFIQKYKIHTEMLCWKENALYLEQTVVSGKGDKLFAIALARYAVQGTGPHILIHSMLRCEDLSDECRESLGQIHAASMGFHSGQTL